MRNYKKRYRLLNINTTHCDLTRKKWHNLKWKIALITCQSDKFYCNKTTFWGFMGYAWYPWLARVCKVIFKYLPQPLRSHIWSFGTLGQLLKIPPFSTHSAGGRGVPEFFFWLESFYFCELGATCKISES